MKQILQDIGRGDTLLAEVAAPSCRPGALRIATRASLVSLGTERMLLSFGQANLLEKARQQPDKVREVLAKVSTDGLLPTLDAVRAKLAEPISLGYCNAGVVLEVGKGVQGFAPGDRVVSNGSHAEVVVVPANLCARVPDNVSDEAAAFTVVGAIGLQGIRLLAPTLGERFVVIGLGLIGLLSVQLLRAHGARVLGVDFDEEKCRLAQSFGAQTINLTEGEDFDLAVQAFTQGEGADGVLVAAATKSSDPMQQAARACRKRGRIVQVGATGLQLSRADLYEKELTVQVSCSYGPGRYDPNYEDKGLDYPIGYVRWTEQRNFQAVLEQLSQGTLAVEPLISHRYKFSDALQAYETVAAGSALGIVLEYEAEPAFFNEPSARFVPLAKPVTVKASAAPVLGVLGAGNFAARTLLPALASADMDLRRKLIVSSGGLGATLVGKKFAFEGAGSDAERLFEDPDINTVLIATRHGAHAKQVLKALQADKHVFVEKPLCLTLEELEAIERAARESQRLLMVGFNRRFSPHLVQMKKLLAGLNTPMSMVYTVNAGAIPRNHWIQDPQAGGGRIVGEGCHFIDLLRFLAGTPIIGARVDYLDDIDGLRDVASLHLRFANGSIGTVHYFANGAKTFPKERLEVFCGGKVLQLDNFKELVGHGFKNFSKSRSLRQDKGHAAELRAFLQAVQQGGEPPIPLDEIVEVSRTAIELQAGGRGAAS